MLLNFMVVNDLAIAKHVPENYGRYAKGLVLEVSKFLIDSGRYPNSYEDEEQAEIEDSRMHA